MKKIIKCVYYTYTSFEVSLTDFIEKYGDFRASSLVFSYMVDIVKGGLWIDKVLDPWFSG